MASFYKRDANSGELIPFKLIDNGDGTFSEETSGGGGGATTIADGADVTLGAKADAAITNPALSASEIALLKGLLTRLNGGLPVALGQSTKANSLAVTPASDWGAFDSTDKLRTALYSATGVAFSIVAPSDILTNSVNGLATMAYHMLYDALANNWERMRVCNVFKDVNAVAAGSIVTVWTPTSGKKFNLMGGCVSVSAACSILFEDNAGGTTIYRTPKLLADTPFFFTVGAANSNGILSAAANNVLKATSSAAANITGMLFGTEE